MSTIIRMFRDSDFPWMYWAWDGQRMWYGARGDFMELAYQLNEVAAYHDELEASEWPESSRA